MVDYFEGYIVLAYRHLLVTFNIIDKNIDAIEKTDKMQEITVDESRIDYLNLHSTFKIICLQEIGKANMTSIVIEDMVTR